MVEVGVGDEEEVLVHGPGRAAADVEGGVEAGHDDARLVAADGDALDEDALDVDALAGHLRPRLAELLLLDGVGQGRQEARAVGVRLGRDQVGDDLEAAGRYRRRRG